MALRPAKFSRVSLNEDGVAEAYVFPQSGPSDLNANSPLVDVPLYRGLGELMETVSGKFTAGGGIPSNLDLRFFPRYLALLMGREASTYSVTGLGTGFYRHRWGIGEPILSNLQMDSLSPSTLTQVLEEVLASGFAMTGAAAGGAAYSPTFVGTGRRSSVQIDATPTVEPFQVLSNLNGQIILGSTVLGKVSGFSQTYSTDIQVVDDTYFDPYQELVGAGDFSYRGSLSVGYENDDFFNLAIDEARPYFECMYTNLPIASDPTLWVRFMCGAARLSAGLAAYGGKGRMANNQEFRGVTADADGVSGISAEVMSKVGPWTVTGPNVDLGFKIDGGATITKTFIAGSVTRAAALTALGTFTGGVARGFHDNRFQLISNSKGAASSVQIDTAIPNSAHAAFGFDGTARSGLASPFVIEVVNTVSAPY